MLFNTRTLIAAAVASSSALICASASPVAETEAVARSMLGTSNNLVSWESQPLERSPSDPQQLDKRIVYNPPVLSPSKHTVWHAGRTETVKWEVDQDEIPADAKNYKGTIKLGYLPKNGEGGLNLHWTLASNFPITDESTDVELPADLETRDDYIIVVMGDSGNRSKKFTIKAAGSPHGSKNEKKSTCNQERSVEERAVVADGIIGRDV